MSESLTTEISWDVQVLLVLLGAFRNRIVCRILWKSQVVRSKFSNGDGLGSLKLPLISLENF